MTVSYSLDVSTSGLSTFIKVLFRWRGSLYKAIWRELLLFLICYFAIGLSYRFAPISNDQQLLFGNICRYCERFVTKIPLSFLLGFYVTVVFNRWWQQFWTIAWPDTVAIQVATYVHGTDEKCRLLRRAIVRYCNLSSVLGLRQVSSAVKKRFPTLDHVVEAGFMTEAELKAFEEIPSKYPKQWVPCQWACTLLKKARKERLVDNDFSLVTMVTSINNLRINVRDMGFYDWVSIPLVYTQVVTLAVYTYFAGCLLARQYVEPLPGQNPIVYLYYDFYFPFYTVLEFVFYVGWLKVAECMINPFGEDDDDFETNFLIERNINVSYTYVDDNYEQLPPMEQDIFWDNPDVIIPHTAASYGVKDSSVEFDGSTKMITLDHDQAELVIPETIDEEPPPANILRKITTFISGGSHHPSNSNFAIRAMRKMSGTSDHRNFDDLRKPSVDGSTFSSAGESGRSEDFRASRKFRTRPLKSRSISASDNLKGIQKVSLGNSEKSSPNSVRSSNRSIKAKFSHSGEETTVKTRPKLSKAEELHKSDSPSCNNSSDDTKSALETINEVRDSLIRELERESPPLPPAKKAEKSRPAKNWERLVRAIIAKKRQEESGKIAPTKTALKKPIKQPLETISESQGSLKENSDSDPSLSESTNLPQEVPQEQHQRKPQNFPWKRISDSVP